MSGGVMEDGVEVRGQAKGRRCMDLQLWKGVWDLFKCNGKPLMAFQPRMYLVIIKKNTFAVT